MGTVYNTNVVTDGIKFYWDAANRRSYPGTGTVWTDVVKGKTGTLDNATFSNQKGGYVEFDGTNDSVQISNDADFTMPAGDWTICVWCADLGGNTDKRHIVGTYGSYPRWVIRDTDDLAAGWAFVTNSGDGWERAYSTVDIQDTDDEWHYLVVTGSAGGSSGSLKLYTDGVDTSLSSSYAVESITRSPGAITMGETIGGHHELEGNIASVAIYSRILTPAEVKQNYEATKSRFLPRITKSGMFANWDAGDPQSYSGGTTWKDTANHYDGTLENDDDGSLTFDSANGGSLVFDGTDDYVGPIAIGDHSSTARSVIIWAAADSYAQSNNDEFSAFNSATDKFSASLGLSNHYGYFYFKSKMTHTSTYQGGIASTSLVNGSWHCWAVTINASDEIVAIYQDGESKTSGSNNGFSLKDDTYIGCRMQSGSVQYPWAGKIGTVRLYTKTLSAAEIMDNFQKTRGRFGV